MRIELQIAGVVSSAVRFPGGMIFFVELQLSLKGKTPDGVRTEPFGRNYFPRSFNGAVTVKETKHHPDTDGWGYCNRHHYELTVTSSVPSVIECAFCNNGKCKTEGGGMQFYPVLGN